MENEQLISKDSDVANLFNHYFNRITDSLNIPKIPSASSATTDQLSDVTQRFSSHPSILRIQDKCKGNVTFEFTKATEQEMAKEIKALKISKKVSGQIPQIQSVRF